MRFQIKLKVEAEKYGRALPFNYQHEMQAVIYKIMAQSDCGYATQLHDNGFDADKKRFKLFTFSNLFFPNYAIDKEKGRIIINNDYATWHIGFLPNKSSREFVMGAFAGQTFEIGDSQSIVAFKITEINIMPEPVYNEVMHIRTLSPVCISAANDRGHHDYLHPSDPRYCDAVLTGLKSRYKAFFEEEYTGDSYCSLRTTSTPKSKLIKIKAGKKEETFVRGYMYNADITLPKPLFDIAYHSGLGEKGSIGFGMII